jgi:hypothetical protein
MKQRFQLAKKDVIQLLQHARLFSLTLDIWTKKSMSASFLGVSTCFFDPVKNIAKHVFLNLHQISHPHTGEMISDKVEATLRQWQIPKSRVLLLITDNGKNMVKAMKILAQNNNENDDDVTNALDTGEENDEDERTFEDSEEDEADSDNETVEESESELNEIQIIGLRSFPCLAHTLQLIIHDGLKDAPVQNLLNKCRGVVKKVHMSSVATESLQLGAQKALISDCPTRWNSTLHMIQRLIELRAPLSIVLDKLGWDSILASEWSRLEDLKYLLLPFAEHTDLLQSDTMSLGSVLPAVLDLECHLLTTQFYKTLATTMLWSLRKRFNKILDTENTEFDVIPAAACLANPMLARILLSTKNKPLLEKAKIFIIQQVSNICNLI